MAVLVGSARIDSRGKISGDRAGDQTGKEVAVENWYLHKSGWVVLRPKSAEVAEKIAKDMEYACANPNIGYDQSQNTTLWKVVEPLGFDCSKVKTPCECDCARLVRVCVAYAGIIAKDFYTGNEIQALTATGKFTKYTAAKYTQSSDYLKRGDILVTPVQGHTMVVLSNGAKVSAPSKKTIAQIAEEVIAGKWGNGDDRKKKLSAAGYNYAEVQKAVNALLSGEPSKTPKWVGVVTNCDRLNVRTSSEIKADNIYEPYPQLGRGNRVDVCDQENGWDYIRFQDQAKKYHFAWVHGDYIAKA